jgi:hypothetical protein
VFAVLKKLFPPTKRKRESSRRPADGSVGIEVGFKGTATGQLKDLSATGVYFETDEPCVVGSKIYFTIELADPSGPTTLRCAGTVVREEQLPGGRIGFGVKFHYART